MRYESYDRCAHGCSRDAASVVIGSFFGPTTESTALIVLALLNKGGKCMTRFLILILVLKVMVCHAHVNAPNAQSKSPTLLEYSTLRFQTHTQAHAHSQTHRTQTHARHTPRTYTQTHTHTHAHTKTNTLPRATQRALPPPQHAIPHTINTLTHAPPPSLFVCARAYVCAFWSGCLICKLTHSPFSNSNTSLRC